MAGTMKQLAATLIVGQVLVGMGLTVGLHSITLIQVPQDEDRFMDEDQLNWTIALTALAAWIGACLALPVAPALGARRLLMLTQPIHALGSLSASLGKHFGWVALGRGLMCISIGMSEGTARAYVSEIVPPNRRTLYTALLNGIVFASQAFSVGIARYVHWRTMFAIAGFVPPVVCLSALYFIPNSPKWLLSHGHPEEEALRAVHFFHGKDADAEAEVHSIQASLKQTHVDGVSLPMRQLILRRETLWPLLLITVELFMYVWSGGMAIAAILPLVLNSVNLPLDEYQRAVMPAALSAILCLPTSFVIERFGRLPLLRVSGAISALGCTAIVSFSYLPEALQLTQGWLALLGAVLLQLTFSCIVLPIAYTYVNELLPNRTRTLCANVTMGTMYIDLFIFFKVFPMLVSSIGLGGVFIIHLLVSVSQIVFATFCLPETKDLSLEQIQKLFQTTKSTSGTASNAGDAKTGQAGEQDLALT